MLPQSLTWWITVFSQIEQFVRAEHRTFIPKIYKSLYRGGHLAALWDDRKISGHFTTYETARFITGGEITILYRTICKQKIIAFSVNRWQHIPAWIQRKRPMVYKLLRRSLQFPLQRSQIVFCNLAVDFRSYLCSVSNSPAVTVLQPTLFTSNFTPVESTEICFTDIHRKSYHLDPCIPGVQKNATRNTQWSRWHHAFPNCLASKYIPERWREDPGSLVFQI